MKAKYEKPVIQKHQTGMMNKFGSSPFYQKKVRKEIEGVTIEELVEKHGSPLFVFSEQKIRNKYREVYEAFSTRYPNIQFGWSYKTNYIAAICSIFHQEGAIAEVVSEMEYDKARKLGVPGKDIIFNGPQKSMKALEKAVIDGAMIHVDHLDEVNDLEKVADKLNRTIKIGIRLNMDTGIYPQWSRFGTNVESGQAIELVKRIKNAGKLEVNGLHCHIGTFILEPSAYAQQVEKMVKLSYEIEEIAGYTIEYLDIGGGLPSMIKLKGTYLPPEVGIPPLDDYAEQISNALYKHLKPGDFPKLILENGRALIDESGYLITTLTSMKRMPDGRRVYVVDGGVNLLFPAFWYKYQIEVDREIQGTNEQSVIYGPLCMNIDVVDESILLPPLSRGTRLILSPVGAYSVTQWMQFIEYRPSVVLVGKNKTVDVIREAEDLTDIERREVLPERLRNIEPKKE
ncbi:MAG: diaminopimelate decarboxylase [Chlamydiales bacterium]